MSRGKQNRILGNIKKNSKNLDAFNNIFQEKAEHNRFKILADFFNQVASVNDGHGCLPSEAELVLEPYADGEKVGWRMYLHPMDRKGSTDCAEPEPSTKQ